MHAGMHLFDTDSIYRGTRDRLIVNEPTSTHLLILDHRNTLLDVTSVHRLESL